MGQRTIKMDCNNKQNSNQTALGSESGIRNNQIVDCLGMTFHDDNERREHFAAILKDKLKDPKFRKIEGFPIGTDEDIILLSNPPDL